MKSNKKGFISSALLYSLLLLFLALILGLIALLSNRKQILDKLKGDIKSEINQIKEYKVYENGTAIYYNPVTGKICGDYTLENSKTGTKEGCLKWYIFNDDKNSSVVNMILDHNTTALVAYNSERINTEMKEVKTTLESDTEKWKDKARLIKADEMARITGNTTFDGTSSKWFYFETNTTTKPSPYTGSYAWLYDNTGGCVKYKCNIEDNTKYEYGTSGNNDYIYGYWTSTSVTGNDNINVWYISGDGSLYYVQVDYDHNIGIRPVISISKKTIENADVYDVYENGEIVYYNPVTGKICGDYTLENSKTGTKEGCLKWYIFNDDKNSSVVNIILDHNTTSKVAYNSTGTNIEMNEVKTTLTSDTEKWKDKARLIKADEIAKITGNTTFNSKTTTSSGYFNLETNTTAAPSTFSGKYAWLYDYTSECTSYGCDIADNNNNGYWTESKVYGDDYLAWVIQYVGNVGLGNIKTNNKYGIRPVITISKKTIENADVYDVYKNGEIVYYNPVTGKVCGNYTLENSKTGTKEGCLKWYIFNDDKNSSVVNMILDHNTTALVAYNSTGVNTEMKEAKAALNSDTSNWKQKNKARLITADEIAQITGATKSLKWTSKKSFATTPVIGTSISWFYLDGADSTDTKWQTQVVSTKGASKYAWLFDNTYECTSYGCNIADNNKYEYGSSENTSYNYGYWTSSPLYGNTSFAWFIERSGALTYLNNVNLYSRGIRPVITISKHEIKYDSFELVYDYTGTVQSFTAPISGKYKIEAWGAQGGNTFDSTASGGLGGYVSGYITLNKNDNIYIYVGQKGTATSNIQTFNCGTSDNGGWNGGGATDVRLINGSWDSFDSLKSRIIVAAGGGTEYKTGAAGAAGGLIGYQGSGTLGGTQTSAIASQSTTFGTSKFGIANGGCTGGNGYYPGGGATCVYGSGGGSSFISGHNGCDAISSTSTEDNIIHTGQSKHYSGLYFTNTIMIDGKGYSWTNVVGTNVIGMPTHDGTSTMTGNIGNGYAKITYLGNE